MDKKNLKFKATILFFIVVVICFIVFLVNIKNKNTTNTKGDAFSPKVQYKNSSMVCTKADGTIVQNSGLLESDNDGYIAIWKNVGLTLNPGETITCTSTLQNNSTFVAYLNEISILSELNCATETGDTESVADVCSDLIFSVKGGNTTVNVPFGEKIDKKDINNETILSNEEGTVSFTISYPIESPAYENLSVSIPTIKFYYETNE